jgi:hypothetical protein
MTLAQVKEAMVVAHKRRNWKLFKVLSQIKQRLKKRPICVDCGQRCARGAIRCATDYRRHRFYSRLLT